MIYKTRYFLSRAFTLKQILSHLFSYKNKNMIT